ncbi:sensor histidine kinase [Sulfurospirillum barnesii]|uniref:histidine kinase n=1 Tax=Sulfurospirillum barnesii (strain ATCC 700032 / DSM 10660 / SES-3) TaxID=760154 RepID=I3XWH0_SULBS|nr:PAS domain-containing sensor histidine kinase [Sulfurospirillum barnesii]AFL68294.1 PAS domain S-box [Sulfurospirillum barnesii SES-3]
MLGSYEWVMYVLLGILLCSSVGFFIKWQKSKQKLSRFIDLTIEGIILSQNNKVVDVNIQALKTFGVDSKEVLIGKPLLELVAPCSHPLAAHQLLQSSVEPYECMLLKGDGSTFPALIRGTNITLKDKMRVSAVVDLSELKKAQYTLEMLNQTLEMQVQQEIEKNRQQEMMLFQQSRHAQMGEMISMIAHQWRQPLNVLCLMSQNIVFKYKMNSLDDAMVTAFKEDSMRLISQMSKTIDDFRDFFKPDKTKKLFDVKKQLLHVTKMLKPIYDTQHIELILKVDNDLKLESFPNEFNHCIINLLNNAKDVLMHIPYENEKYILIEAFKNEANKIVIVIEDNGGGIEESILPRLFEPYFSTKEEDIGTGLGLYMTKMIIEEHMQGRICASNVQGGARFEIIL